MYIPHEILKVETINNELLVTGYDTNNNKIYSKFFYNDFISHLLIDFDYFTFIANCNKLQLDDKLKFLLLLYKYYNFNFIDYNKIKIVYIDIENCGSVDTRHTPQQIISAVAYDEKQNKFVCWLLCDNDNVNIDSNKLSYCEIRKFNNESKLIYDLLLFLSKYDIICGWNILFFDMPYLLNRAKKLGIDYTLISPVGYVEFIDVMLDNKLRHAKDITVNIAGLYIIDLMQPAAKLLEWMQDRPANLSLNEVSRTILKSEKIQISKSPGELWKSKNYTELLSYNLHDVELMIKLNKTLSLLDFLFAVHSYVKILNLDLTMYYSKVFYYYLLMQHFDTLANINLNYDMNAKLIGGFVTEPHANIYDNVYVFDFTSLYPNIILQFNISIDTLTKNINNIDTISIFDKFYYRKDKKGILVQTVEYFMNIRKYYKQLMLENVNDAEKYLKYNLMQLAAKVLLNSAYGVFGYRKFKFFNADVINSITTVAQNLLKGLIKVINDTNKYKVIYADTDSLFVIKANGTTLLEHELNELFTIFNSFIYDFCTKCNCNEQIYLKIEYETYFKRLILSDKKKKYIGYSNFYKGKKYEQYTIFYKGIDFVKKDTPVAIRKLIKQFFNDILVADKISDVAIFDKLVTLYNDIKKVNVIDLLIHKNITKEFAEYKVKPQHVRAAELTNKYYNTDYSKQNYTGGMLFVKKSKDNRLYKTVVFIDIKNNYELLSNFIVDYDKYFVIFVINKLKVMLPFLRKYSNTDILTKVKNKNKLLNVYLYEKK